MKLGTVSQAIFENAIAKGSIAIGDLIAPIRDGGANKVTSVTRGKNFSFGTEYTLAIGQTVSELSHSFYNKELRIGILLFGQSTGVPGIYGVCFFVDDNDVITFSNVLQITSGSIIYKVQDIAYDSINNKWVIAYNNNSGYPSVKCIALSGTTISTGAELNLATINENDVLILNINPSDGTFIIKRNSENIYTLTISGTTISKSSPLKTFGVYKDITSYGKQLNIKGVSLVNQSFSSSFNNNAFQDGLLPRKQLSQNDMFLFDNDSVIDKNVSIRFETTNLYFKTLTISKAIGIAKSSASDGGNVTYQLIQKGDIFEGLSGLAFGKLYNNGVCVALSSTKLLMQKSISEIDY